MGKLRTQLVSGEDNHCLKKPFPYPWEILILELNINAIFVFLALLSHLLTLSFLSLGSGQNHFLGSYFPIFVVKLLIICDSWQLGRFLGSGIIFLSFFVLVKMLEDNFNLGLLIRNFFEALKHVTHFTNSCFCWYKKNDFTVTLYLIVLSYLNQIMHWRSYIFLL